MQKWDEFYHPNHRRRRTWALILLFSFFSLSCVSTWSQSWIITTTSEVLKQWKFKYSGIIYGAQGDFTMLEIFCHSFFWHSEKPVLLWLKRKSIHLVAGAMCLIMFNYSNEIKWTCKLVCQGVKPSVYSSVSSCFSEIETVISVYFLFIQMRDFAFFSHEILNFYCMLIWKSCLERIVFCLSFVIIIAMSQWRKNAPGVVNSL